VVKVASYGFTSGFGAEPSRVRVFHHISGTITAVDGRTRNPPDPGDTCDTSDTVPDTRACGSRRFHTGLAVESPLGARRRYVLTDNGSFTTPALNAPEGVQDCERDGFQSFAFISGTARPGAEDLTLPRYPSDAHSVRAMAGSLSSRLRRAASWRRR
jgi:hypothetical protein